MLSAEDAYKKFEGETLVCTPTDRKRLIIPAYGFKGAKDAKRPEWPAPTYEMVMQDVKGLTFHNPKDDAEQVLKQNDGCLICYDAPGLQEKVEAYLEKNPNAFFTAGTTEKFIDFLKQHAIDPKTGKADVYDTDVDFAAGLIGAPAREDIKPGKVFSGAKKKETMQAFYVKEGTEFEGAAGTPQVAGKGGAYILKDTAGMRLIQSDEFAKSYAVVKRPKVNVNVQGKGKEMD